MAKMAGKALILLAFLVGCDDGAGGKGPPTVAGASTRAALVASVGRDVIVPTQGAFVREAGALVVATRALAAAPQDAAAQATARAAFWRALEVWQGLEVVQVGPAAVPGSRTGGQGLRDRIYAFPTVNPCRVDQELASEGFQAPDFFTTRLVNAFGFAALEYLLFAEGAENACPPQVAPNSDGTWAALTPEVRAARRAAYALRLAEGIEATGKELQAAWSGAFLTAWTTAGQAGSPFASAQAALDELYAALFYVELDLKDVKIGDVAGITAGCQADRCPESAELRLAGRSREAVIANLQMARRVFAGAEGGTGFVHLLRELGAAELADRLLAAADAAIAEVEKLNEPFDVLAARDPALLRPAYDAVKGLTDLMKSQLATVLNLSVPQEGAADND